MLLVQNYSILYFLCLPLSAFILSYAFMLLMFSFSILLFHFISTWRTPFRISYKSGLVVMDYLSSFLSEKVLISLSFLKDSFVRYTILDWQILFSTLNTSSHSLLAWKVSSEKSTDSSMMILLSIARHFLFPAFKILSVFYFDTLITMDLHVDIFSFLLFGNVGPLETG